jgi:predicted RNA binding protein YcfA (HicA-like mRNA interferase family)
MNSSQRKTLVAIFCEPAPRNLEWRRVESLLVASGFKVIEGHGSRVRFEKDGLVGTFHRPHPNKEAKPYQVRDARQLLESLGIKP